MLAAAASSLASKTEDDAPRVTIKNGTLVGAHLPGYDQDLFLGVPFAQPPVGDLRFRNPQSINESWDGERTAQRLPPACVGYGVSELNVPSLGTSKPQVLVKIRN